jgi:hypothetical protein
MALPLLVLPVARAFAVPLGGTLLVKCEGRGFVRINLYKVNDVVAVKFDLVPGIAAAASSALWRSSPDYSSLPELRPSGSSSD